MLTSNIARAILSLIYLHHDKIHDVDPEHTYIDISCGGLPNVKFRIFKIEHPEAFSIEIDNVKAIKNISCFVWDDESEEVFQIEHEGVLYGLVKIQKKLYLAASCYF